MAEYFRKWQSQLPQNYYSNWLERNVQKQKGQALTFNDIDLVACDNYTRENPYGTLRLFEFKTGWDNAKFASKAQRWAYAAMLNPHVPKSAYLIWSNYASLVPSAANKITINGIEIKTEYELQLFFLNKLDYIQPLTL